MKKLLILLLLLGLNADGLKRKPVKKTLYTSKRACDKARVGDSNADCSVVDLQIDTLFQDADTNLDLYVLVSEVPVQSVDISPVASGTGSFPTSWGARGVSREPQAVAGTIPSEIQDDIVIITNTRVGFSSTTAKRVSKITVGQTEYGVPILARNAILGGRTVIYQAITGGLPTTGDWDGLVVHFTDGTQQPAGGVSKQKRLKYTATGGGALYLGDHNSAVFQIPALANTRLTVVTANTPVFHNISSFTGAGVSGVISQSAVSNIGRVTVAQGGYVNIAFEDEIRIVSSTAGGAGNSGELVYVLTHYGSDGTDKRSWWGEHAIEDPVTAAINIPIGFVTGLTPVQAGDYFTLNFSFNSSRANDVLTLALPADNPGLDERVEFFYWPTSSIVPVGPRGPPGPAGATGPAGANDSLIGLPSLPSDLTSYVNGEIIFVNTPDPGSFYEILGADANERHSFRTDFAADANNAQQSAWQVGTDLNYGYSSFGDVFGELYTADGGQAFTPANTPVMRMEIEQEVATRTLRDPQGDYDFTFNTTYTLLIRKTDLTSAPATIYARYYTGPPANDNQVTTIEFMKGSDNPAHDYHTYIDRNGADISVESLLSIKYFSLFTSSPATDDQTSNPLNLHDSKSARKLPEGADFSARSADTTKALKLVAEETTPPVVLPYSRQISKDIPLLRSTFSGANWSSGVSDGTTVWFVDFSNDYARAFNVSTRVRDSSKDINLGSGYWSGGFSNGTTVWFVERYSGQVRAYNASTRVRDSSKDINLGSGSWRGSVSDGTTVWFITGSNARAYNVSTRVRDNSKDINLGSGMGDWTGGVSDGTTVWFVDFVREDSNARAYNASTRVRDNSKDINLGSGIFLSGVFHVNTIWFIYNSSPRGAQAYESEMTQESKADTTLDKAGALSWLQSGIDADIDAKVPQQFRGDAVTTGQYFQPTEFAVGTAAQITALTKKEGGIYFSLKASQ